MNIKVNSHTLEIEQNIDINAGEYNITTLNFEFSDEYEGLTKMAVFSNCETSIKTAILDNQCTIPFEVLEEPGQVKIGVYGYSVQDDELVLRYSPTPQIFVVTEGSYKEGTEPVAPTPTDWEILVQQVSDNSRDIADIQEDIGDINTDIGNINNAINDLDDKKANINDLSAVAFSGSYNDLINKPNLSVYATKTDLSDEATLRENADVALQEQIDAISVSSDVVDVVGTYQELLDYDTQHLKDNDIVKVLDDSTHNNALSYYRWDKEPQTWSYIGSEGPFYTKAETKELLNAKEDKITTTNKLDADLVDDSNSTNKFVTEEDITYWDNKEDKSNKVTEINSSSTDTQYPSAKCVYESQTAQDNEIDTLKMIYNILPTDTDTGETISIDNTGEMPIKNIQLGGNTTQEVIPAESGTNVNATSIYVSDVNTDKEHTIGIDGNTYQETTTGANLMPVVNITKTVNGITLTNNENGTITLNGTATAQVVYPITNTGNNTLRIVPVTENDYKFMLYGDTNVSNDTYFLQVLFGTETETTKFFAATDNGATSLHIATDRSIGYGLIIRNGQSFNNHIIKPMGVLSTYTGGFEPYTYGASPNPSYPQNIEVVTGENDIIIEGKNLALNDTPDNPDANYTSAGTGSLAVQYSSEEQGYYTTTSRARNFSKIGGGTFTLSLKYKERISSSYSILYYKIDSTNVNSPVLLGSFPVPTNTYETYSKTITVDSGYDGIRLIFYPRIYWNDIQLEQGSTATTYEPYVSQTYPVNLGNIELCKIDTYKDRIYNSYGKWYLEKQIGKATLTGNEPVTRKETNTTGYYRFAIDIGRNIYTTDTTSDIAKFYCNKFVNGSRSGSYTLINCIYPSNSTFTYSSFGIYYDATKEMTTQQFQNWLSQNGIVVYYPYATPTTTEITDSTLVSQLNALANSTLYSTTNINTTTSNLLPYIDLQYNVVTPAPSPSRPSTVNVVKGNNTITISNSDDTQSQTYPINLPSGMELCKISTYQDYFYKDNGNWYKHSEIGKVVLNGTEEGWTYEISNKRAYISIDNSISTSSNSDNFKCNYFLPKISALASGNVVQYAKQYYFYNEDIVSSKNEWLSWLSNNNTIVYYILATPINTQITDTTLINQLDNLQKAISYDSQTNISQTNEDKPFIITAEMFLSLKNVLN